MRNSVVYLRIFISLFYLFTGLCDILRHTENGKEELKSHLLSLVRWRTAVKNACYSFRGPEFRSSAHIRLFITACKFEILGI